MLQQEEFPQLSDRQIELMLHQQTPEQRERVIAALKLIKEGLAARVKEGKFPGLGKGETMGFTLKRSGLDILGRAGLKWILETDGFHVHMEVPSDMVDGVAMMIDVVLQW